jgi:hypothetical protein
MNSDLFRRGGRADRLGERDDPAIGEVFAGLYPDILLKPHQEERLDVVGRILLELRVGDRRRIEQRDQTARAE